MVILILYNNDNNNKNACMHMRYACMNSRTHAPQYALMHLCSYVSMTQAGRQARTHARMNACACIHVLMYASVHEYLIACA